MFGTRLFQLLLLALVLAYAADATAPAAKNGALAKRQDESTDAISIDLPTNLPDVPTDSEIGRAHV